MLSQGLQKPIPCLHLCQLLKVHAQISKPDLYLHPGFPYHVRISQAVHLLGRPEDPLYGLLPFFIDLFVPSGMTYILTDLHVVFPYMTGNG